MKKFAYLLALSCFLFAGCSDDSSYDKSNSNSLNSGSTGIDDAFYPSNTSENITPDETDPTAPAQHIEDPTPGEPNPLITDDQPTTPTPTEPEKQCTDCDNPECSEYCQKEDCAEGCSAPKCDGDCSNESCNGDCNHSEVECDNPDAEGCKSTILPPTTQDCSEEETICSFGCVNLNELNLSSCTACKSDFVPVDDNDLSQGCTIKMAGAPPRSGCPEGCADGDFCLAEVCVHRYYTMLPNTPVTDGNGVSLDNLKQFSIVNVAKIEGSRARIVHEDYNNQSAWIDSENLMDAGDLSATRFIVDDAELYLYNDDDKLCTYDFLQNVSLSLGVANTGTYRDHNEDFVLAVLRQMRMLPGELEKPNTLTGYLNSGDDGYQLITNNANAKAGDVLVADGQFEIIVGYYEKTNQFLLIGSHQASEGIASIELNEYGCSGGSISTAIACSDNRNDCPENERVTYILRDIDGSVYTRLP